MFNDYGVNFLSSLTQLSMRVGKMFRVFVLLILDSFTAARCRDLSKAQRTHVLLQHSVQLEPWVRLRDTLDEYPGVLESLVSQARFAGN